MLVRTRAPRDDAGAIAVLFAICSMVLFLIAALVVDLGLARDVRRQSQNASDASALAAGNVLYPDRSGRPDFAAAVAAAEQYAAANMGTTATDWQTCTDPARPTGYYVVPGTTACISFDERISPTRVRVKLPDSVVKTSLGGVAGVQEVDVDSMAEANVYAWDRANCGVCIVGTGTDDLQNGNLQVTNANLRANGSANQENNGSVKVINGNIGVAGTASGSHYNPTVDEHQPAIADPLRNYTLPVLPPDPAIYKTGPCTNGPGIYGNLNLSGQSSCTLQPGIYYITGTWSISGQAKMDATSGVTLYFVCSTRTNGVDVPRACATSGEAGGQLDASGTGGLAIHAPTTGPTQGITILYDRHNTSTLVFTGQGTQDSMVGTVYALSGKFRFNGNGSGQMMDTLIIVDYLDFNGNPSLLNTTYTPENNAPIIPVPLALSK